MTASPAQGNSEKADSTSTEVLLARAQKSALRLFEILGSERTAGRPHKICLAESCTGGLVSELFTEIAGSSDFLWGALIVYTVPAKAALLGLDVQDIAKNGVVSEATARGMAAGAIAVSGADFSAAVTGFAGPGTDPGEDGPGRVAFGWARAAGPYAGKVPLADAGKRAVKEMRSAERRFPGGRQAVRLLAADFVLSGLGELILAARN